MPGGCRCRQSAPACRQLPAAGLALTTKARAASKVRPLEEAWRRRDHRAGDQDRARRRMPSTRCPMPRRKRAAYLFSGFELCPQGGVDGGGTSGI